VVTAFMLRRIEIPKCDNHCLGRFITSAVRDGTGCCLTVHWLDIVALAASQSLTSLSSREKFSHRIVENSLSWVGIALSSEIGRG
jgi:hypothetical protein